MLRRMNYLYKLLLSFLLTSLPPLVIMSFFFYFFSSNIIRTAFEKQAGSSLAVVESDFSTLMESYKHRVYSLSGDEAIIGLLSEPRDPDREGLLAVYRKLYSALEGEIYNAYLHVISADGKRSFSTHQVPELYSPLSILNREGIFGEADRRDGRSFLYLQRYVSPSGELSSLSVCRPVKDPEGKILGYVILDILKKHIIQTCTGQTSAFFNDIIVMDNRRFLSFDFYNPENDGDFSRQPFLNSIPRGKTGTLIEGDRLIAHTTSQGGELTLAGVVSLAPYLLNFRYFLSITLLLVVSGLVLSTALAFLIARSISRPIHTLSLSMEQASSGNLAFCDPGKGRRDEIGLLYTSYNTMIRRIQELMTNQVEKQKQLNIAEVKALQAQINPHFLYNALNTVKSLAKLNDIPEITTIVTRLGQLLRSSFETGEEITTVRDSLELIRGYLEIQKIRFKDKLAYRLDIPEELHDRPILKFALQPLVENAIVHGLENKVEPGTVSVTGALREGSLEFVITDDGVGFDLSLLETLQERKESIGIRNVQRRIQLCCGAPYGLDMESRPGEGTRVELRLPADREGYHD